MRSTWDALKALISFWKNLVGVPIGGDVPNLWASEESARHVLLEFASFDF